MRGDPVKFNGVFNNSYLEIRQLVERMGSGYAILDTRSWLPHVFLDKVSHLEKFEEYPFNKQSIFLVRDFDGFSLRGLEANPEIKVLFAFLDKLTNLLANSLGIDTEKRRVFVAFAEIRTSSSVNKYQLPHYDEATNDFVAITPLTRKNGTLYWDKASKLWRESPVGGTTFVLSTSKKNNPTYHYAPEDSRGVTLVTRFRILDL